MDDLIRKVAKKHSCDADLIRRLSRWLKRIAMRAYPEHQLAAKTGDDWLRFLDSCLGDRSFSNGCGNVFGAALYRREVPDNPQQLLALCERWLVSVQPRLLGQGGSSCSVSNGRGRCCYCPCR